MPGEPKAPQVPKAPASRISPLLWASGVWAMPFWAISQWMFPHFPAILVAASVLTILMAPVPALVYLHWMRGWFHTRASNAEVLAEQLKLQLETVRQRTAQLREELRAADQQARLSHQLTLLGQFSAGFMHEFNNPLAIVAGRLEVLLDERREDRELCADLERMLKEANYMSRIATTLLQALRRERGGEVFDASAPHRALEDAMAALGPLAVAQGVHIVEELGEAPHVDVPEHVVGEVVRGLIANALQALSGQEGGAIWVRLDSYRTAGAKVVARIEDNGPGVPENLREHIFEPFVSQSSGRERLGLGLFLAASLLDMYDGRIRYETRDGGGASFIVELPPARFTRGQPYHWFASGGAD